MFNYFTESSNVNEFYTPIVGIVVTISPNFNLYRIVVLPAASNPTINILISFLPNKLLNNFANVPPIFRILLLNDDYVDFLKRNQENTCR